MTPITPVFLSALTQSGLDRIVDGLAEELETQLDASDINTLLCRAHFLGQMSEETSGFTRLSESMSYSLTRIKQVWKDRSDIVKRAPQLAYEPEALANAVYAGVNGNGPESSGDGFAFIGRGGLMLSGRGNYKWIGDLIKVDLVSMPTMVAQPKLAVQTAIAFWNARDINQAADDDDISAVTRLVNGGVNGLAMRAMMKHRALKMLAANG